MAHRKEPSELMHALALKRWGDAWLAELAVYVDVSQRTVRRWHSGERPVPRAVVLLLQATK